jgi:methylmalonyl-CoA mutase, N-terminal domain
LLSTCWAVMGGCQSLHTNSRDEALALPSAASARLALRTQQIIAHESGVGDIIDPLGGAWALEQLTDELEARAQKYLQRVDELGGMVRAIQAGYPQQEIQDASYQAQRAIESKETVVVGMNEFVEEDPPPRDLLRVDESVAVRQAERLAGLKSERSGDSVRGALDAIRTAAKGQRENLLPLILGAVKSEATLGEISDALREVFGEHKEILVL